MKRLIFSELVKWKNDKHRKVLLVRGARQVGKTFIIRELGATFERFIEINFEKDSEVCALFEQNLDPDRIVNDLSLYSGVPMEDDRTLLFFDEIQRCPRAITALRYFYENRPKLHVIAAGSLLEFALEDLPSFGVGRIRSLFMYPMSFDEYLFACNEEQLVELKGMAGPSSPLNDVFHKKLIELLKKFLIIGGMPEVIKTYLYGGNITDVQKVLSDITVSYYDDFGKYRRRIPSLRLREVMDSVVRQAGGKYIYSKAGASITPVQAKEALQLLEMAGLVHKTFHTSGQGVPLGSDVNHKKFKVLILDNGLQQMKLNIKLSDPLLAKNVDMLNKGSMAEIFTGLEMIKYASPFVPAQLFYWHREKRGSSAEVDYLVTNGKDISPVEVKSGRSGKMQSMNLFIQERNSKKAFRVSLENFTSYGNIEVLPLYAISNLKIWDYLS